MIEDKAVFDGKSVHVNGIPACGQCGYTQYRKGSEVEVLARVNPLYLARLLGAAHRDAPTELEGLESIQIDGQEFPLTAAIELRWRVRDA